MPKFRSRTLPDRSWQLTAGVGALAVGYLLQTASGLRLDSDSVVYLYAGSQFADGVAPRIDLSLGYAFVLAALDRIGLGSSFFFVLANCAFLTLGLFCLWQLASISHPFDRRWLLLLALASAPMIHTIALPLPEPAYFGVSLLALLCMQKVGTVPRRNTIFLLLTGVILTAFAISLRNAGIALLPALLWASIRGRLSDNKRWQTALLAIIIAVVSLAIFAAFSNTTAFAHSIHQARVRFVNGVELRQLPTLFANTLIGAGEMILNIPYSRFKSLRFLYLVIGALSAGFLVIRSRPRRFPGPAEVYAIFYLIILFFWPYPSPRLWMPIVPLLIWQVGRAVYERAGKGAPVLVLRAYVCWFILTGMAALAYTTRVSLRTANSGSMIELVDAKRVERTNAGTYLTFDQMLAIVVRRYGGGITEP